MSGGDVLLALMASAMDMDIGGEGQVGPHGKRCHKHGGDPPTMIGSRN